MEKLFWATSALLVIILFAKCRSNFYANLNSDCKTFLDSIDTIWEKQEKGYYSFNFEETKEYGLFVHNVNNCLSGIKSKQLIDLFGEPNVIDGNVYTYFMTSPCLNRSRDCNVQQFTVKNDTLVSASLIRPWGYSH